MADFTLSAIHIYPIKSLGGVSLSEALVTDRGFRYDRRWMLVDGKNKFLTQRIHPQMALLQVTMGDNEMVVSHKQDPQKLIKIPLDANQFTNELDVEATVWDDNVSVRIYDNNINEWFSAQLNIDCKLVYMPDTAQRKVDSDYAKHGEQTSLSDGYPFLIIGQESLNLLNSKIDTHIPMNRFRPNLVFAGGNAHDEDNWREFKIGDITFYGVKKCSRCVVTTIDQQTTTKSLEPLKTLATYRTIDNKIMFGINLLHEGDGIVKVGEKINV